jgi:hypothetical protein
VCWYSCIMPHWQQQACCSSRCCCAVHALTTRLQGCCTMLHAPVQPAV